MKKTFVDWCAENGKEIENTAPTYACAVLWDEVELRDNQISSLQLQLKVMRDALEKYSTKVECFECKDNGELARKALKEVGE